MTDRELMQQALDCLLAWEEESSGYGWSISDQECVKALRARLAQPEPEPVAWLYEGDDVYGKDVCLNEDIFEEQKPNCIPLYTAPSQREWQGLTDEEVIKLGRLDKDSDYFGLWYDFARAIEAKLKEKNT